MASRLQKELQSSLSDAGLIRELEKLGNEDIGPRTPQQVTELLRADLQKWARVIREANITLES
jgi:tripartite-type tricarboxylate transporter receptor subunit TctC